MLTSLRFIEPSRSKQLASILFLLAAGCTPPQAKAPEAPAEPPAYQPNFSYTVASTGTKLDVTLGIINPQFKDTSALYSQAFKEDDVKKTMLSAMNATFNDMLIAKGFNTKGPFASLEEMTYPDKKISELVFYPVFDFQVELKFENLRSVPVQQEQKGLLSGLNLSTDKKAAAPVTKQVCDGVLSVFGNVAFVLQEPISGQKMFSKSIDVTQAKQTFANQEGDMCTNGKAARTREMSNAWAKAHELVFQSSMKAMDSYLNGEEVKSYKQQSKELRDKKTY